MKIIFAIFLIFLARAGFGQEVREVCFKDVCVRAEVADTSARRERGLMYRKDLPEDQGMLFIFEEEASHGFWMKNMNFPLDIIWIDGECNVADIKPDIQPCQEGCEPFKDGYIDKICPSLFPADKALYVLEVNSGFSDKHKIQIGDRVRIDGY